MSTSSSSLKPPDGARKPHSDAATEDSRRSNQTRKASPAKSDHSGSSRSLEKIDEAEEAAPDRSEGDDNPTENSVQPSTQQQQHQQQQQQQQQRPSKQKAGNKKGARAKPGPADEDGVENNSSSSSSNSSSNNNNTGPDKGNDGSGVAANGGKTNGSPAASGKGQLKTNPADNSVMSAAASPTTITTATTTTTTAAGPPKTRDPAARNGGASPLAPPTSLPLPHHAGSPQTHTLPGRPPPLPAVNSGGAQTARASHHPSPAAKPGGISQARGSQTSRPAWDSNHSPHGSALLSPAKSGDAFTMTAEEWRAKADVPSWRKHSPAGSAGGGDAADVDGGGGGGGGGDPGLQLQLQSQGGGVPRRDTISSRDDGSSYAGDEDEGQGTAGRKFTKKAGNKDKFGSSTTLSSATETSDDNGDGNFHVVMRVRPLSTQEKQRRDQFVVSFPGDGQCSVESNGSNRNFQFNVVFEPDAAQDDVFENCGIKRLVDSAVSGYTCTAFAFGQTGSGKTHTMTGPPSQYHQVGVTPDPNMYGIIQRSFKYMYQQIKHQGGGKLIRASYLEIYNEQVIDLLNNSHRRYLSVRWSKNKGFYVENLFTVECDTLDDLMAVLEEGLRNRQTGSHGLNEFSSRSHSVLTVTIDSETQPDTEDENLYVTKRGKLSFVDLAGSEKVKDSSGGFGGPGMLESNSINKSLLVLGNCISHLGDAKRRQGHIPYRDSKLTKLLSDSLAGNGITLMIACITPSSANTTETMNTLRYASRAKKIKSKPTVKMDPREKLILNLKREIKVLRNENHYLRQQLDFPAKPKGQLQKENDEKFMKFMKEQKEKESGLYEMLQEYMVENESLRAENSEMHSMRDRIRREQQLLYRENEKLMKRVEEMEKVMMQNPGIWTSKQQNRTDGYGQYDLVSPRGSPVASGYQSGHKPGPAPMGMGSPPGSRGKVPGPMRPPHRLPDPVMRPAQRPAELIELENGGMHPGNNGFVSPRAGGPRQTSPSRHMERGPSQVSTTDAIHSMNEQLKKEVMQLEGQIRHHQYVHERSGDLSRSNGHSVR